MNRILIIEDEEVIRKQLSKLLERNNYVVNGVSTIECSSGHHDQPCQRALGS